MKFIQVNVFRFHYFDQLIDFLIKEDADVVCMQEVGTGLLCDDKRKSGHREMLEKLGYFSVFIKSFSLDDDMSCLGNMILSKYPLIDYGEERIPLLGGHVVRSQNSLGLDIDTEIPGNKYKKGILWQDVPTCIVWATVLIDGNYIRVVTSHFSVSQKCTETFMMRKHAEALCALDKKMKLLPTILSGDFNIGPSSYTVGLLKDIFEQVIDVETNSLHPRIHPGFRNDIPAKGYQVDHVLQRGFDVLGWSIPDVDVSDHLPVVVELKLKS